MDYLARKIHRPRWRSKSGPGWSVEDIKADAVTKCLVTSSDKLSMWECDDTETDVNEIVLALHNPKTSRCETMDIVLVRKSDLNARDIMFVVSPDTGDTLFQDLKSRHVDLVELSVAKLTYIATLIRDSVRINPPSPNPFLYRVTVGEVRRIMRKAVEAERIRLEDLPEGIQVEVSRATPN